MFWTFCWINNYLSLTGVRKTNLPTCGVVYISNTMFRFFLYWRRKRRKVYMANSATVPRTAWQTVAQCLAQHGKQCHSASHNMGILSYCRAQWNLIRLDINPYLLYPFFSAYLMYLLRNSEYSLGHIMYLRLIDWVSIKKWDLFCVFWSFCCGVNVILDLPGF